jgi:glutamate N-acetyltransferase/amino-acid N-acetyltransferase
VKTAIHGADANWGRIITAIGYSGADFDPNLVDIYIGKSKCCLNGAALDFDEAAAKAEMEKHDVKITVDLKKGGVADRYWTCDFSEEYVKINGSYRT